MNSRFASLVVAVLACACLCVPLAGCGVENLDDETRKSVGFGLGMLIIAASGIGFFASSRYYATKRRRAQQRKRQRANKKKR